MALGLVSCAPAGGDEEKVRMHVGCFAKCLCNCSVGERRNELIVQLGSEGPGLGDNSFQSREVLL